MHRHHRLAAAWFVGAVAVIIGLAAPAAVAAAGNRVTDVTYGDQHGAFRLTVVAQNAVTTHVNQFPSAGNKNLQDYVVDVSPAAYDGRTKDIAFKNGAVQRVRVGQLSDTPAVTRIVVETQGSAHIEIWRSNGNREVSLAVRTAQAAVKSTVSKPATVKAVAVKAPAVKAAPVKAASAKSVRTKTVARSTPSKPRVVVAAYTSAKPAPAKPKVTPAKKVVAKPSSAASAPRATAAATPNPWLPGGKYYCKIPGMPGYRPPGGGGVSANYPGGRVGAYAGERTVSIDVKNADILDVLRLLAQQSGQNIITTQHVTGTTSVSLHNVPLSTALNLVVRTNGLEYRKVGNVYIVGTPEDLAKQFGSQGATGQQTVAFPIKYAKPDDLAKQLANVVPSSAFTVDARTDTLLVTGTPDIIQSVRNFLALADVPAPQIVFEVKVLDVTGSKNSNAGIAWSGASAICLFEQPVGGTTCPGTTTGGAGGIGPNPFLRTTLNVNGVINYLITTNQAQLLATPRVAALNNQQASLLIGQTYPIVYYSAQAGNYQVQYIDIGVKLQITPVINTDGYITTTMHVERSLISGFVQQYPILDNRKVDDTLRVKDGDTIVLGGLIDDSTTDSMSKVPLLGDIPVFGALFKNRQQGKIHNEVVFLITPHILSER
jgi:Flp pilus assembly secretin CpaC